MTYQIFIGSAGVGLLLLAFFLNLFNILKTNSGTYLLMNIFGAYLSCYASVLIGYWPFVILEGTWSIVAIAGFATLIKKKLKK